MTLIAPTKPVLPPYEDYITEIKSIWQTGMLTNNGPKLKEFKRRLQEYTTCPNLDLFVNGHGALVTALKALELSGEVITSPFTFASTTNAIVQAGLTPVFCDIDGTYNIDANKIADCITDKTCAIVTPHIFGIPCNVEKIQDIAECYSLKVIYDAAQAFGTKINGKHIVSYGDITMVSFHAIKIFNSIEGGMLVYKNPALQKKFELYRNFGINYETNDVEVCGYNAKMNEFQAAMGICNLKGIESEIEKRHCLAKYYAENLKNIPGIIPFNYSADIRYNHAYYPVIVNEMEFGITRDELHKRLRERGIATRKLYDKLTCDTFVHCGKYKQVAPHAEKISRQTLDLPIYGDLTSMDIELIAEEINKSRRKE